MGNKWKEALKLKGKKWETSPPPVQGLPWPCLSISIVQNDVWENMEARIVQKEQEEAESELSNAYGRGYIVGENTL